jgi:hypothetical protein
MKAFLDYLVDRPERRVAATEVGEAIGYDRSQVAGLLGAFGRRWKNRYQNDGPWFVRSEWDTDNGMWLYWIDNPVAHILRAARRI